MTAEIDIPPLRPGLTPLPPRMVGLRRDARGYPVPAFVQWCVAGSDPLVEALAGAHGAYPEFRMMDRRFFVRAIQHKLCWVCAQPLGIYQTFVIGPMCAVNRTSAEPPCHLACAEWSAVNCPFLSRPHMVRREDARTEPFKASVAGVMIDRNPGVTLLWTTRRYTVFDDGTGKPLLEIGDPAAVQWYAEGRPATRAEVEASIQSGVPLLEAVLAEELPEVQPKARAELTRRLAAVEPLLPV